MLTHALSFDTLDTLLVSRPTVRNSPLPLTTVYGTSLTGSDDLLLALLEDPLAGEEEGSVLQRESLLELIDRSKGSDIVSISYVYSPMDSAARANRVDSLYGCWGFSFGQGLSGKVEGASDDQVLQETRLESTAPFLQVSPDIKLSFIPCAPLSTPDCSVSSVSTFSSTLCRSLQLRPLRIVLSPSCYSLLLQHSSSTLFASSRPTPRPTRLIRRPPLQKHPQVYSVRSCGIRD